MPRELIRLALFISCRVCTDAAGKEKQIDVAFG
jgi:hypothetical protein